MEQLLVGAALAVTLLVVWVVTNARHVGRRGAGEWSEGRERPDLWTSAARCVECGAQDGVLELQGDDVMYVCLRCGARTRRETRG